MKIFISGDEMICQEASSYDSNIKTIPVNKGIGNAVQSISPQKSLNLFSTAITDIFGSPFNKHKLDLPEQFDIKIEFLEHRRAYRASFYPGVVQHDAHTICYTTTDYMDFLKMFMFV